MRAVHERNFGAIETDALSAVGVCTDDIVRQFDVARSNDGLAVMGGRRLFAAAAQFDDP